MIHHRCQSKFESEASQLSQIREKGFELDLYLCEIERQIEFQEEVIHRIKDGFRQTRDEIMDNFELIEDHKSEFQKLQGATVSNSDLLEMTKRSRNSKR